MQKFWLAVGKQEQLRRFKERDDDPLKRFKVDPEDWENRGSSTTYPGGGARHDRTDAHGVCAMDCRAADDKSYARLLVLRTVCEAIEAAM